jgi:DNA topoisomerase I
MNLGIRVGDEKGEDSSDTVGASSLRKEHVSVENNFLKLDFLGKDSVRYLNKVEMGFLVKTEFEKIINNIDKKQQLFPDVSSVDVKDFLNEVVEGISAKVFRTAWGSSLLAENLKNAKIKTEMTQTEKIVVFNEANLFVAKKLNHQKNVGKNCESKIKNMEDFYIQLKDNYKVIEKDLNDKIADLKLKIKNVDEKNYNAEQKSLLKKSYKNKINNYQERLDKNKKKMSDYKIKMDLASKTKNVALGTSKTSYCDPRIGISFCKSFDIQLEKVYNKAMQDKFSWALDCKDNFFKNYKTIKGF